MIDKRVKNGYTLYIIYKNRDKDRRFCWWKENKGVALKAFNS